MRVTCRCAQGCRRPRAQRAGRSPASAVDRAARGSSAGAAVSTGRTWSRPPPPAPTRARAGPARAARTATARWGACVGRGCARRADGSGGPRRVMPSGRGGGCAPGDPAHCAAPAMPHGRATTSAAERSARPAARRASGLSTSSMSHERAGRPQHAPTKAPPPSAAARSSSRRWLGWRPRPHPARACSGASRERGGASAASRAAAEWCTRSTPARLSLSSCTVSS